MLRKSALALLSLLTAAHDPGSILEVDISGLRNARGLLHVCITRNPAHFPDCRGGARGFDLTLIGTMPLGEVDHDRGTHYLPLSEVRQQLGRELALIPSVARSGGPARYWEVDGLGIRLGLITPLTNNFCAGCNRIRVAATGTVYGCLGHDQKVELRELLRAGGAAAVDAALDQLLAGKPERHRFRIAAALPAVARHMSVTGG